MTIERASFIKSKLKEKSVYSNETAANIEKICNTVDMQTIDKIYSNTPKLTNASIIYFIRALVKHSR